MLARKIGAVATFIAVACVLFAGASPAARADGDTACDLKCISDYIKALDRCMLQEKGDARDTCNAAAKRAFEACERGCVAQNNACYDKCDRKAKREHKKCDAMEDGPDRAKCRAAVEERRGNCYRDCNRKGKG